MLSWTYYKTLLQVEDVKAREWYAKETVEQTWSVRTLQRNLLCTDTDADVARYSVLHGNEQLFATKYKTYLPTEEELKAEIESQKAIFEIQQQEKNENNEE